jgi:phage shock protein PspC (stress-responsive transcriptional regulator)
MGPGPGGAYRRFMEPTPYAVPPRLVRPRHGRVIAGVCAGLARRFGWSPTGVRLVFLLSCLLPGPQIVIYLLLWVLVPAE